MKNIIIFALLVSLILCQEDTKAIEFEENPIQSELHQFSYKTNKTSMILILTKNENININSYDEKVLTIYNKITQESKDYTLSSYNYIILEDVSNENEFEYIFKFKNYNKGNFIVFSSSHSFPLNLFEKGFGFLYYFSSGKKDVNLTFHTEMLKENTFLDIYPGDKITLKKISKTGSEEIVQIKNNFIELSKDYKYIIQYYYFTNQFEISIKKREIITYNKSNEYRLNLYNQIPNFILIQLSQYNNDIIYNYLYYYDYIAYDIEISEIDTDKIDDWDKIKFINNTRINTQSVYEINTKSVNTTYILIKLTIIRFLFYENQDYFYTYKIFEKYQTELEPILSNEETLIIYEWKNKMVFIESNIANLRSFENKEPNTVVYQRDSDSFAFIILPTKDSYSLNIYSLHNDLNGEIYLKEKFFHNYLSKEFDSVIKPELWYFGTKEASTLYISSYFGNPKIYYTETLNQEIINDLEEKKFEKVKEYKLNDDIVKFKSSFALYIDPYENTHINFILNQDANLNIGNEASNKYLIKDNEYTFNPRDKFMVRLDNNFIDSQIDISKDGTTIATLNKENPFKIIDEPNKKLSFKSDKDALINFYYNINNIFFDEAINIINFPKDKQGQIMIVKILSNKSKYYYYAINYGFDDYIPPDTKKISTTQTYFYIEVPYSIMEGKNKNLNHYLILFGKNIKYEVNFVKKYEKEKNKFYYKIKGDANYGIVSELNYPSDYFTYEVLLCDNDNVNISLHEINNSTEFISANKMIINQSNKKALFTFESKSDFIFFQKENKGYPLYNPEIKYFIPKIENNKISLLLINEYFEFNTQYSVILFEDINKDDKLLRKLDNECFLFSLINNERYDINEDNYEIKNFSIYEGRFLYEEIDYSKFVKSKYLLIKIYTCNNEKDICVFSKTQRIYLENLKKEKDDELGITEIEEFQEYKVTKDEYIFSYDYKNYLNSVEDILIYISAPTAKVSRNDYIGEVEVINPSMQSFIFKYRYTHTIPLIKKEQVTANGKYYLIFKNCSDVTFYLHNTISFFPLNKINNYISETDHKISNGDGMIYFTMDIKEDKYIYLEWNTGQVYLYSISDKKTEKKSYELYNAHFIKKGSYILILEYGKNYLGYHFSININHYILNLDQNKETKVDMGIEQINQPTLTTVLDLSKYEKDLYLVSETKYVNIITCEKSMDINSIIENGRYGSKYLDTHIIKVDEINQEKCDPPYYNVKLYNSRFEFISDVYDIEEDKDFSFTKKDTVAFTVRGKGFNFVSSNQNNLRWLDQMQNEYFNMLLSNKPIQFKFNPDEENENKINIKIFDNLYNISFDYLTNNEMDQRIRYNNDTKEIKYYINLSKNKYLINHFDYNGKIEFYISKREINENDTKEILKTNDINMNIFDKTEQNKFDIDSKKILAIKKEKNIFSELLISPLINDFIVNNTNSKFILENKSYYMNTFVKILLEENSDAKIKVYDLNDTEIATVDKNNPLFETKIYNKTLYLKSDKDALIYVYYHIKEHSRNFVNQTKEDNTLIIFSSDCRDNKLKYCIDNGFENYTPKGLNLINLEQPKMFIKSLESKETTIQKGTFYTAYLECQYDLIHNYSDFYKNSSLNEGSYLIGNNLYLYSNLNDDKKNIFYQLYECENSEGNEYLTSIDEMKLEKLNVNPNSFINGENHIEFFLKAKYEFLFNYYITKTTEEEYNNLEKNDNPKFNLTQISKDSIRIDITPKYKTIDFEFYVFMYIDKEGQITNDTLSNKCFMKKLLQNNKEKDVIIKKIEFKDGKFNTNIIDISNYEKNYFIHINILGKGIILDNIEEYIFYEEQVYKIKDSDNRKINAWVIIGPVLGVIIITLIIVIVFLIRRKRNKMSIDNDENHLLAPVFEKSI